MVFVGKLGKVGGDEPFPWNGPHGVKHAVIKHPTPDKVALHHSGAGLSSSRSRLVRVRGSGHRRPVRWFPLMVTVTSESREQQMQLSSGQEPARQLAGVRRIVTSPPVRLKTTTGILMSVGEVDPLRVGAEVEVKGFVARKIVNPVHLNGARHVEPFGGEYSGGIRQIDHGVSDSAEDPFVTAADLISTQHRWRRVDVDGDGAERVVGERADPHLVVACSGKPRMPPR